MLDIIEGLWFKDATVGILFRGIDLFAERRERKRLFAVFSRAFNSIVVFFSSKLILVDFASFL